MLFRKEPFPVCEAVLYWRRNKRSTVPTKHQNAEDLNLLISRFLTCCNAGWQLLRSCGRAVYYYFSAVSFHSINKNNSFITGGRCSSMVDTKHFLFVRGISNTV